MFCWLVERGEEGRWRAARKPGEMTGVVLRAAVSSLECEGDGGAVRDSNGSISVSQQGNLVLPTTTV